MTKTVVSLDKVNRYKADRIKLIFKPMDIIIETKTREIYSASFILNDGIKGSELLAVGLNPNIRGVYIHRVGPSKYKVETHALFNSWSSFEFIEGSPLVSALVEIINECPITEGGKYV